MPTFLGRVKFLFSLPQLTVHRNYCLFFLLGPIFKNCARFLPSFYLRDYLGFFKIQLVHNLIDGLARFIT